jgi:hypothetical protein
MSDRDIELARKLERLRTLELGVRIDLFVFGFITGCGVATLLLLAVFVWGG